MNKKGTSILVATVLLTLIIICAIGIIWYAIIPSINQAQENAKNQTNLINFTNSFLKPYIDICKKNCEELGLDYHKVLDDVRDKNSIGCFCQNKYGFGDIVRIW